jgi:hypothetical protein
MDGLGWVVIEQVVNFVFFLDLILNAHTGYVRAARALLTRRRPAFSPQRTATHGYAHRTRVREPHGGCSQVDDATRTLIMDVRLTRTHYLRTWCVLSMPALARRAFRVRMLLPVLPCEPPSMPPQPPTPTTPPRPLRPYVPTLHAPTLPHTPTPSILLAAPTSVSLPHECQVLARFTGYTPW